nr:ABC transporter ATP-binding protein [uncultured Pseudomonas sp.]
MIAVRQLGKRRGDGEQRFTLQVERLHLSAGQALAIVGPSGCGKSTLLDLLALTLAPDTAATFDFTPAGAAHDVAAHWRQGRRDRLTQLRSRHIGYVLQAGGLLGFLDVRGNIALPRRLSGLPADGGVERLAQDLDIHGLLGRYPDTLSVGQRQRVGCARALAHGPQLLLADEPTAALDPVNAQRVMHLLLRQVRAQGIACVVASHDEALMREAGLTVVRIGCQRDADGGVTARLEPVP